MDLEDDQEKRIFSRQIPPNDVNILDLHTLGQMEFDISFD